MKLLPIFPFTWESQARQYAPGGEPGLSYFAGAIPGKPPVDCLLWRSGDGALRGVLNYFPVDYPPWEQAGNITLMVDPSPGWRRQGIAHRLLAEADRRWSIVWTQQGYTKEGLLTAVSFLSRAERWDELNAMMAELRQAALG